MKNLFFLQPTACICINPFSAAVGRLALFSNKIGSRNTDTGINAGISSNTTECTFISAGTNAFTDVTNSIVLGSGANIQR
ncbi:MAG: hypothetical protein M3342_20220 [Bacteroidota bacterium]|nr:hypothetical protein [Bacteroidota bacterium]